MLQVGLFCLIAFVAVGVALVVVKTRQRLRLSERQTQMSRKQLMEIIASINDGVILMDEKSRIVMCNVAFCQLTGHSSEQLIGFPATRIGYAYKTPELNKKIQGHLAESGNWCGNIQAAHSSGRLYPARLSINKVDYTGSPTLHFVATLTDISQQQAAEQKIRHLAYHDVLTGLPNRRSLQERLAEVERENIEAGSHAMLMLLDVDRFKALNDTLGQARGDLLLRRLADRLKTLAQHPTDLARLDGNEFALLRTGLPADAEQATIHAKQLATNIAESLNTHYDLEGHRYLCRVSCGLVIFASGHRTFDEAFKKAGLALLDAKRNRERTLSLFEAGMERRVEERIRLESELSEAITGGQLRLFVQPQVNRGGRIVSAEALVRWQHPERGLVSPGIFIPLAEETGLIVALGDWVLDTACRMIAEWQTRPERRDLYLSVNVSVRQFQQPNFVGSVLQALERRGAPANRLTLELTESVLMSDVEQVIKKMTQLKHHGISFALDDFGTGYSSLAYLRLLPLDTLKIDVSFVQNLTTDPSAMHIVNTIISLAKSLGLNLIAEGVETEEQQAILERLGCDIYQGYLFSRPQPVLPDIQAFEG